MRIRITLLLLLSLIGTKVHSQVNIMGKPGYINTPSAEWFVEKPLGFSFSYVPNEYSLFNHQEDLNEINFYNVRADFTSFMSVNLSLAYRPDRSSRIGVGDRQLDFRFKILKESKYLPVLVLGWTPPGTRLPILAHDYIVATKNFETSIGTIQWSAGYGSPYVFTRNARQDNTFWKSLKVRDKREEYGNDYLYGFFSAVSYKPVSFVGITAEYDSNSLNAGAFIQPWEWLILQGTTYEGKEFAFSAALNFSLDFLPNSLRKDEKAQD
ncbi:YjbH domain-containing protein [Christiangramia echinicola]|uniref:Exopolysaccharide biosynthesis protein YbjH n=1 Tax=Christiangramia echinicola TaxID=279359 RepID=A0A1H1LVV7_9FLAO|nr:YjbH domain-containing protein [Christiangramia echinicola]SDR77889.1 Exopolysaccharide biosynthesis protein YbjH [Christiangramia echinicola]